MSFAYCSPLKEMKTATMRMSLRNLLVFTLVLHQTLTFARALPTAPRSRTAKLPSRKTVKVKRSQESPLRSNCQDPGIPANGHRVIVELQPQNTLGKDYFPIGTKIRFGCEAEYLLRGSAVLSCERGGGERPHWDSSTPQCVGKLLE